MKKKSFNKINYNLKEKDKNYLKLRKVSNSMDFIIMEIIVI